MPTLDELREKFYNVISGSRRLAPIRDASAPPARDPRLLRADRLQPWMTRPEAVETLRWIDAEIVFANASAHREVGTPRASYWLGIEAGLRAVRDEMIFWQTGGQPSDTPSGRPAA